MINDWPTFLHWARRFADVIDLDAVERRYKLELAESLSAIRPMVASADERWTDDFIACLRATNLLNWRFISSIEQAA